MNPMYVSSDQFPAGLRVLAVDDDPTCLVILEKMLQNCLYQVTKCSRAEVALKILRENRDGFDVVISDVHMPDMDGFTLVECIGLEMDLPVIMMSADDSSSVVLKGVTHGACDYLIKPVRMEALKNIWQHVVRKEKLEWREKDIHAQQSGSVEEGDRNAKTSNDADNYSSANEGNNWKSSSKKRKDTDDEEKDDTSASKKPRVVWTVELHQQFVSAVNQLGIDKAVPKRILEIMNVPGRSRENVASHLQKYRLYLKKLSVGHHQNVYGLPFMAPTDPTFVPMTPSSRPNFQNIASSSQLPHQGLTTIQTSRTVTNRAPISGGLVDQGNFFSFENQRRQHNNNKQVNLLHGIPTNVNLPMHPQASQMVQPQPWNQVLSCPVNRQPMTPNMGLGRNRVDALRAQPFASSSHPSSSVDISRSGPCDNNAFPLISNKGIMMGTTTSNHAVFNNMSQNKNGEWTLHRGGPTFDATRHATNMQARADVAPSVLAQPGFSSYQSLGQQLTSSTVENSLSRMNPDGLADMGFQNSNPLSDQFGHDDLLSAFFKQPEEGESIFEFDGYDLDILPV